MTEELEGYSCYTCGYVGLECVADPVGGDDDKCHECGTVRGDGFGDLANDPWRNGTFPPERKSK